MRAISLLVLIALAVLPAACGGGGGASDDTARFCELMTEFNDLATQAVDLDTTDTAQVEEITTRIDEIITEAEEAAPAEVADIFSSTDEADQEQIVNYIQDECGVTLPGLG